MEVLVQGTQAWFGPARRFPLASAVAVNDGAGHPAIQLFFSPSARKDFEGYTTATVSGPLGIFVDGELVAVPASQPVPDGNFTFCNEAGGWTAADRDRWLARIRAAEGR